MKKKNDQNNFLEKITSFKEKELSLEEMLKAGVHFGHRKSRWNPKMKEFIFTTKEGIHVIDLIQTKENLIRAVEFMKEKVKAAEDILFVGTKRQVKGMVKVAAEYVQMPYVTQRWLGGTLTNFEIIKKRIDKLLVLEDLQAKGELKKYTKKEQADFKEKIDKFNLRMGGIKHMKKLPGVLFVIDPVADKLAVKEALRKEIPVVALADTNSNPDEITFPIPANDDAVGSVGYLLAFIAYHLGQNSLKK